MGLDTVFIRANCFNKNNQEDNEVGYWRKCYGVNNWLVHKATKCVKHDYEFEFSTDILKPIIPEMEKYLDKMIKRAKQIGYIVDNTEELFTLAIQLYDEDNYEEYCKIEQIIKLFNCEGLTYQDFQDSIWCSISTFIQTYDNFKEAINYPTLTLIQSY